jgi:hypothetical protein
MFHDFVARSASSKTAPALGKLITVTAHRTTWGQNIGYEIAAIASSILEIVTYFAFQRLACAASMASFEATVIPWANKHTGAPLSQRRPQHCSLPSGL